MKRGSFLGVTALIVLSVTRVLGPTPRTKRRRVIVDRQGDRNYHPLTRKQHICTIHSMKQSADRGTPPKAKIEDHGRYMVMLLEAARSIEDRLEGVLTEVGLTSAKYQAIDALARAGEPLTLSELASQLKCVRSNITQLVDRLEADGLVERVDDPTDRRAVRAIVTPLGMKRKAAGAEAVGRLQAEVAAHVAPAERAVLNRVLAALK